MAIGAKWAALACVRRIEQSFFEHPKGMKHARPREYSVIE
jgi:hypothetical protein